MKKLKIRTQTMLGTHHSWSITMLNLFSAFEKMGHELYMNTTNGIENVPKKWFKYFRDCDDPDIDINYTLPSNWTHRFAPNAKMKMGIYNYESSILPAGWNSYHNHVDYILPSSQYCKDIFTDASIPNNKVVVLPLGIDFDQLNSTKDNFLLKTKKKIKILNVSIPHVRKNIPLIVDAFLKEFNNDDDVCLVIKSSALPKIDQAYEINVLEAITAVMSKNREEMPNKKPPQIEFVDFKFKNLATLYDQCDAIVNVASSEGFGLPLLEAMARGKIVAAPKYGGVLDFLNKDNSLLIDTAEVYAPANYQYWHASNGATIGYPIIESTQKVLRTIYEDSQKLQDKFAVNMKNTTEKYTWHNTAQKVIDLFDGKIETSNYEVGELI